MKRESVATPVGATTADRVWPGLIATDGALLHPWADCMFVGGLSVFCYLVTLLLIRYDSHASVWLMQSAGVLSFAVNNPHFAYSYQILYDGFWTKVRDGERAKIERVRYLWAGVVVPIILGAALVSAAVLARPALYSALLSTMYFVVGWHYVKQGYGVLIVLSARRRIFLNALEKRLLWFNAYAVWIWSWTSGHRTSERRMEFGLSYSPPVAPEVLQILAMAVGVATSAAAAWVLVRRYQSGATMPVSAGLIGYFAALYLWLPVLHADPNVLILAPLFHSLQYLPFVWRLKASEAEADTVRYGSAASLRSLWLFLLGGVVLGALGFWLVPKVLDGMELLDPNVHGPALFLLSSVLFINIHHYFIDNVLWRGENRDVSRHLVGPRPAAA